MKCRKCDQTVRPGQRYCGYCGAQVDKLCAACNAPAAPDARFCAMCGASFADGTDATRMPDAMPTPGSLDGERRQLTVLFADVVGSTALAGRLDPEALREVLRAYQDICSDCVARYDGNIKEPAFELELDGTRCPLWVESGRSPMSANDQKQTCPSALAMTSLPDHVVRTAEERRRNSETERLGGPEVDHYSGSVMNQQTREQSGSFVPHVTGGNARQLPALHSSK